MNHTVSIYLDLVRFAAAMLVFVVHANYERLTGGLPVLWRLGNLGNDAVMVFFVLSGYVIAHVASTKELTFADFASSRLARLYSVALPALLLTAVVDAVGIRLEPQIYAGDWYQGDVPLLRLAANALFVNEVWFASIRPLSNGPFWSLSYEFWYYAIFAAARYASPVVRWPLVALACLIAGPKILLLFPVWLLGAWLYVRRESFRLSPSAGWCIVAATVATYLAFHGVDGENRLVDWTRHQLSSQVVNEQLRWSGPFLSNYVVGALFALHLIGVLAVLPSFESAIQACGRPIRYLAGFTFGTYLFHYPLLHLFAAMLPASMVGGARVLAVSVPALAVSWLLASWVEPRKTDLKLRLQAVFAAPRSSAR